MFTHGLSITKVLGGISKGLTIIEQVIPIYQKVSPTITNLRNIISNIKPKNSSNINIPKQIKTTTNYSSSNNPTFFN